MTDIEQTLAKKESKYFKLIYLAERNIKKLNKASKERSEDYYYADSWEQCAQISKSLERINEKIKFLEKIKRKLECRLSLTLSECTQFKKICKTSVLTY